MILDLFSHIDTRGIGSQNRIVLPIDSGYSRINCDSIGGVRVGRLRIDGQLWANIYLGLCLLHHLIAVIVVRRNAIF